MYYIGIDIGGTKCAVSLGCSDGQGFISAIKSLIEMTILQRSCCSTKASSLRYLQNAVYTIL